MAPETPSVSRPFSLYWSRINSKASSSRTLPLHPRTPKDLHSQESSPLIPLFHVLLLVVCPGSTSGLGFRPDFILKRLSQGGPPFPRDDSWTGAGQPGRPQGDPTVLPTHSPPFVSTLVSRRCELRRPRKEGEEPTCGRKPLPRVPDQRRPHPS